MTARPLPYQLGVSVNPGKWLVVLWINGAPLTLTGDQARILEGLIREARGSLVGSGSDAAEGATE